MPDKNRVLLLFLFEGIKLNKLKTAEERYRLANQIINHLNAKIKTGWTVFENMDTCVYEDQLQYSNAARVYKEKLKSNNCYSHCLKQYTDEIFEDLSRETRDTYLSRYRVFGLWLKKNKLYEADITCLDNKVMIDFFTYLKQDRDHSVRTYRSYSQLLLSFFKYLFKKGIIEKNPVYNIPRNRNYKDMGPERIKKNDLEKLMKTLDREDPQLALVCRFEYYCGLRPGYEVRFLRIGDIDFRKGYSKVRVILENAKTDKRREIAIPDVFLDYLLDEWKLDTYDRDYYVFGKNGLPGNKHLGKNNFRVRFNKFRKNLDLPYENIIPKQYIPS